MGFRRVKIAASAVGTALVVAAIVLLLIRTYGSKEYFFWSPIGFTATLAVVTPLLHRFAWKSPATANAARAAGPSKLGSTHRFKLQHVEVKVLNEAGDAETWLANTIVNVGRDPLYH